MVARKGGYADLFPLEEGFGEPWFPKSIWAAQRLLWKGAVLRSWLDSLKGGQTSLRQELFIISLPGRETETPKLLSVAVSQDGQNKVMLPSRVGGQKTSAPNLQIDGSPTGTSQCALRAHAVFQQILSCDLLKEGV